MSSESGPESAEIVAENSGTGSNPFFRGPFELYYVVGVVSKKTQTAGGLSRDHITYCCHIADAL